jgi:tetratricopeptide (TPR) repeat protein
MNVDQLFVCGAEAIKMYSQAIAGNEHDHVLFSNRSASYLAIGLLEQALWDAKKSIALNPNWAKGYYRQGCAFESLNDWESAYSAFSKALEIMPGDREIMEKESNARKRLEEDVAAMNAAAAVERHNLVLKLRDARHEDQKLTMLNQFKQSMTAPDWELDDLEWYECVYWKHDAAYILTLSSCFVF